MVKRCSEVKHGGIGRMKEKLLAVYMSVILLFSSVPVLAEEIKEPQITKEAVQAETAGASAVQTEEKTGEALFEPTAAPSEPTAAPPEPTAAPPEPTAAPSDPTIAPSDPTIAPSEPTIAPSEPTMAPSDPTIAPSEPTAVPPEPTTTPSEGDNSQEGATGSQEDQSQETDKNNSATDSGKDADSEDATKDSDDWLEQLSFASRTTMSEGDVIYKTVPDFSPEIHEYTLYLPDFTKGIYGLGVSSYSEPVLSTYVNHNGERESVNLNAYAKYGNYQAMDYIVDYGPGENTMQIHSKSGTKDYLVHVKRILSLGYLKAAYQGTEYVLYNHEREELFADKDPDFQKEYDLYLPGNTTGQTLSLFPETYYCQYADVREKYRVTINGTETPTDEEYACVLKGGEEDVEIRLSYEGVEDTVYTLHIHPVQKSLNMTFSTESQGAGDTFFVEMHDQYGAKITSNKEDPLIFTGLLENNSYSYVAYADGYQRVKGQFTATEENGHINIEFTQKAKGHYLEEMTLNTRQHSGSGGMEKTLVRHEELDQELGGITYVAEYSNQYSSNYSFFLSASLSAFAPAGSEAVMSATDVNGNPLSRKMLLSKENLDYRNGFTGDFFKSGEYGARRGICTVTVGNGEEQEVYKILVTRTLALNDLTCSDSSDGESIFNEKRFFSNVFDYTASITDQVKQVYVKATIKQEEGYSLFINGQPWESGEELEIPITDPVTVIPVRLAKEETYVEGALAGKTYTTEGNYSITIKRSAVSDMTFQTDPEDALVCVYDPLGKRVMPSENQPNMFAGLKGDTEYSYTVSCYGFKTESGTFTAQPGGSLKVRLERADTKHEELTDNEWWNYRNNEENNGVTSVSTPNNPKETSEKWALQISSSWSESCTPPLILGGQLYTGSGKYIYKVDKETGKILAVSDQLKGSLVFALNPLTYAEGMIFAQVGNGQVQAVDATTLKSVWISEVLGGQTLSPITYKNGYIYTGTWNSESKEGTYFCLSVTDEDPDNPTEIKKCAWKFSHMGGFYWAGSYATEKYLVFGSDDGSREGSYTASSILYSVSAKTGIQIDMISGLDGDIRTSIVYDNGYIYFATKGGILYRVQMHADGTFGQLVAISLGGMATASPVVHNGRIYIGVCGTGGQFQEDAGHHFDVLTEDANGLYRAYSVPIRGYPQAGATLSTAYENEDYNGDGKPDGRVYVYFTYNVYPGGISFISDEPGQTEGKAEDLYIPDKKQQQYCISTICADSDGTLYYKNDSGYLMAISSNSAYLDDVDITCQEGKVKWDDDFSSSTGSYTLTMPNGTKAAFVKLTIPSGRTATVNGQPYTGITTVPLNEQGEGEIQVVVEYGQQKRTYRFKLLGLGSNADLASLIVSDNNAVNVTASQIPVTPAFSKDITDYTSDVYTGGKKFLNIFASPAGSFGKVTAEAGEGTRRIMRFENTAGTLGATRFAVYFDDQAAVAQVTLKVTAGDGVTVKEYHVALRRTDTYPPVLSDTRAVRIDQDHAQVSFKSNETGYYYLAAVDKGADAPVFDLSVPGTELLQGENSFELDVTGGSAKDIYILAVDSYGNKMETPVHLELQEYKLLTVSFVVTPAQAQVVVQDDTGRTVPQENGSCTLFPGNHYTVTVSLDGYYTKTLDFVASEETTRFEITLESSRSSDSALKQLYVSSSDKYGKGILKLTPAFSSETINYQAVYEGERSYLNLWPQVSDPKATVKVYAVGGVKKSTVSKEDESIEVDHTGSHPVCRVYFEKQVFEASVRIAVTAEDQTRTDYFVKLYIKDTTAPVLKPVSASRISQKKASVIFKSGEKGRYYYKVTEKGGSDQIDTSGKGIEGIAGTNIITLKKLSAGEKEIHIIMKDEAGNFSNVLTVSIPDSRKSGSTDKNKENNISGSSGKKGPGGQQSTAYIRNNKDSVEEGDGVLKKMNKTSSGSSENPQEKRGAVGSDRKKPDQKEGKSDTKKKKLKKEKSKKESTEGQTPEKSETKTSLGSSNSGAAKQANVASASSGQRLPGELKVVSGIALAGGLYLIFWIRACVVNRTRTAWKRRKRERNQVV